MGLLGALSKLFDQLVETDAASVPGLDLGPLLPDSLPSRLAGSCRGVKVGRGRMRGGPARGWELGSRPGAAAPAL